MRVSTPSLDLVPHGRVPQRFEDKFGGRPFGLPSAKWPSTSEGRPMHMLFQLCHAAERLDLGRSGRVVFGFYGRVDVAPVGEDALQSAVIVIDEPDIVSEATPMPSDAEPLNEAIVREWTAWDDGIDEDLELPDFYDEEGYESLGYDVIDRAEPGFRLGGAPCWSGGAGPGLVPESKGRMLLQFRSEYLFKGSPPSPEETGLPIATQRADGSWQRGHSISYNADMVQELAWQPAKNIFRAPFAKLGYRHGFLFEGVGTSGEPFLAFQ